jgi:hypothetical protein
VQICESNLQSCDFDIRGSCQIFKGIASESAHLIADCPWIERPKLVCGRATVDGLDAHRQSPQIAEDVRKNCVADRRVLSDDCRASMRRGFGVRKTGAPPPLTNHLSYDRDDFRSEELDAPH